MTNLNLPIDKRAEMLANNLLKGANALANFAQNLSDEEWNKPVGKDTRGIGLVVHHVAALYPVEIELAQVIASGNPITEVTKAAVDQMNSNHAKEFKSVSKEDTLDLLKKNSETAADAIRQFTDEELMSCQPVSLYGNAPVSAQFFIEDHAMRHSYHHLAILKESLGK